LRVGMMAHWRIGKAFVAAASSRLFRDEADGLSFRIDWFLLLRTLDFGAWQA